MSDGRFLGLLRFILPAVVSTLVAVKFLLPLAASIGGVVGLAIVVFAVSRVANALNLTE